MHADSINLTHKAKAADGCRVRHYRKQKSIGVVQIFILSFIKHNSGSSDPQSLLSSITTPATHTLIPSV